MTKREAKPEVIDLKGLLTQDGDFVRAAVEALVQAALEAEMTEAIGAAKGERSETRIVCLLARHCRLVERAQIAVRLELCEGLAQGLWGLRGKQRALDATAIGEMVEDLLADELPFAVAVGRQDHLIAVFERCSDGLEFRRLVTIRRRARRIEAVWLEEGA